VCGAYGEHRDLDFEMPMGSVVPWVQGNLKTINLTAFLETATKSVQELLY
jgi:hypothetical protein